MPICSSCGSEVAGGVKFCASCGQPTGAAAGVGGGAQASSSTASAASKDDNVMAALAYLVIPAIIFLVAEPYKNNRFIRFHSFQAIFFFVASFAINITLTILSVVLAFVGIGFIIGILQLPIGLALMAYWIFVLIQAFQGKEYRIPVIGDYAARQV